MGDDATTKGTQYSLYCLTRSRLRRDSRFFEFSAGLVQIIFRKNTFETLLYSYTISDEQHCVFHGFLALILFLGGLTAKL
jgi:hypothetical protein